MIRRSRSRTKGGSGVRRTFGGDYGGPLTLRRALMRSANAATVRLSQAVGERRVAAFAQRSGIQSRMDAVPALALGALEVTPLELVAAYAPFANGGIRVQPYLVSRIEAADGTVLWQRPSPKPERVLGRAEAFQITSMLAVGGRWRNRSGAAQDGCAGPRGRQDGNDEQRSRCLVHRLHSDRGRGGLVRLRLTPRHLRQRLGRAPRRPRVGHVFLNGWHERSPSGAWSPPLDLVERTIDASNGELANEWCPVTQREWFKAGTEPTRICHEHDAPFLHDLEDLGKKIGKAILGRDFRAGGQERAV